MSTKKISNGNKEPFAIILEMMKEMKEDMKNEFLEVDIEMTSIKEDISY
ncbi:MAG: hypothetical protein HUJ42_03050 [Malacoplasma sp.]|nr:hypothetical protein [Malacoplasma sp.]